MVKILNNRRPICKSPYKVGTNRIFLCDCGPLRKDPDVLARVLEEFDPSGTQEIFPGQVGLRWIG